MIAKVIRCTWTDLCMLLAVVLLACGTEVKSFDFVNYMKQTDNISKQDCLDVAIIGGGVGGTYAGYKLRNDGLKIGIFEFTDRIGGRMFTAQLPGVEGASVEFGAMRFVPDIHTSLLTLVEEVGLEVVDFPQGSSYTNPNETIFYLRGRHLTWEELGGPKTPYNLRPEEQLSPLDLVEKLFKENTNISEANPGDEIYSIYTSDEFPLYQLSLNEFYSRYASREAYEYIRDALLGFTGKYGTLFVVTKLLHRNSSLFHLKTIAGGFSQLPEKLKTIFLEASKEHSIHLNQQLVSIGGWSGRYRLNFAGTRLKNPKMSHTVVCAKKVVLALQRDSVERLSFQAFQDSKFRELLNSVEDRPAQKIYLAYSQVWWKEGNEQYTRSQSNLPSGQAYEWLNSTNDLVVYLPSYCSHSLDLWRQLQNRGSTINGSLPGEQRVTTEVVKLIHSYMSEIYGIPESEIPPVVGGGMKIWNRFPFKAAWHYYKPGYKMEETRDNMMKPFPDHDVFIVGSSWWPDELQGWSEGTLRMVELWFERYIANL